PPNGRQIPPGGRESVRVQFSPVRPGVFGGEVALYFSDAAAPTLRVPLHGAGDAGCFSVVPATLDFGTTHPGCGVPTQTAIARNHCNTAVTLEALSAPAPYGLAADAPATPLVLAAGDAVSIPVTYAPSTAGDDVGMLSVKASTSASTYGIGLTGGAASDEIRTDAWDQSTPKVD